MNLKNKIKAMFKGEHSKKNDSKDNNAVGFDFEQFTMEAYWANELRFIQQPEKYQIRVFDDQQLTVASFIERVLGMKSSTIKKLQVITDDWDGKEWHDVDDIGNYDMLFSDYVERSEEDGFKIQGGTARNMMFHILCVEEGINTNIFIHYRGDGFTGTDCYMGIPVSVIVQNAETNVYDPYLVYMTFSVSENKKIIDNVTAQRNAAIEKAKQNKELTIEEMNSLGWQKNVGNLLYSSNRRMKEEWWGDSISDLKEAYKLLKDEWFRKGLDEQKKEKFFDICYRLGYCYHQVKLYQKALFYLELTNYGTIDINRKKLYFDCLMDANDVTAINAMVYEQYLMSQTDVYKNTPYNKADLEQFDKEIFNLLGKVKQKVESDQPKDLQLVSKLGVLLRTVFDIHPTEISTMLVISGNKEIETVTNQSQIWNYDFVGVSEKWENFTVYISYRTYRDFVSEEFLDKDIDYTMPDNSPNPKLKLEIPYASVDKSKCRVDNDIIINFDRQGDDIMVSVMVPQFQLSDNNNNGIPQTVSVKYGVNDFMSNEEFDRKRDMALVKLNNKEEMEEDEYWSLGKQAKAHKSFIQGLRAFNSKHFGDALYYFSLSYNEITLEWSKDDIDEFDNAMFCRLCYSLGYCYSELKQYELSIYYLSLACNAGHTIYTSEYINSLANSNDIRALSFIANEMERVKKGDYKNISEEELNFYTAFLNRRYGYTLIETRQWDKAKAHFENLLGDPACHDYAIGELDYIKSMEQD